MPDRVRETCAGPVDQFESETLRRADCPSGAKGRDLFRIPRNVTVRLWGFNSADGRAGVDLD